MYKNSIGMGSNSTLNNIFLGRVTSHFYCISYHISTQKLFLQNIFKFLNIHSNISTVY
jgi:hypothetical protein